MPKRVFCLLEPHIVLVGTARAAVEWNPDVDRFLNLRADPQPRCVGAYERSAAPMGVADAGGSRVSRTESVQHSTEYWRYTAQAMDELLADAIDKHTYQATGFQRRLLEAAIEFLTLALGSEGRGRVEDPSASIANFGLATRALRGIDEQLDITEDDIKKQLSGFMDAIASLRDHGLAPETSGALPDLQRFFHHVFQAADSESYSSLVHHDAKMPTP